MKKIILVPSGGSVIVQNMIPIKKLISVQVTSSSHSGGV